MGTIWLRDLDAVVAAAGLDYRCWHDWQTRSRSSGGYDKLWAVFAHHTASNTSPDNDAAYMWDSTSGDQPIGAILLERSGRVTIGAAGATNCQGKGGPYATSHGTIPADKGNAYGIAVEAANAGTGEAWPPAQQDAYVTLCAALCAAYGLDPARDVAAHFEWTSRKIDPAGASAYATGANKWNMNQFRQDCCAGAAPQPPTTPPPPTQPKGQIAMYAAIMKYTRPGEDNWAGWFSTDGGATRSCCRDGQQAKLIVAAGAVDAATCKVVTDPEWDGVSHTQSEGDLSAYLGRPS